MPTDLDELIRLTRHIEMTDAQRERQRRSFAYGNAHLENDLITREMVDRQAAKLDESNS
jgi:hypothetical protein